MFLGGALGYKQFVQVLENGFCLNLFAAPGTIITSLMQFWTSKGRLLAHNLLPATVKSLSVTWCPLTGYNRLFVSLKPTNNRLF